jgi:hypothetical protein
MVQRRDGRDNCSLCGEEIPMPRRRRFRTVIIGVSGKPNVRVVTVEGAEVHRCEIRNR